MGRMRRWELAVALDPGREQPLFLQLASTIADDIRRGRLKAGEPLPGTRELAESLGGQSKYHRRGYNELLAEGLVSTRVGGGTFVGRSRRRRRRRRPRHRCRRFAVAPPLQLNAAKASRSRRVLSRLRAACRTRACFPRACWRARFGVRSNIAGAALLTYADACGHRASAHRAFGDAVAHARPAGDSGQPDGDAEHRAGDRSHSAHAAGAG